MAFTAKALVRINQVVVGNAAGAATARQISLHAYATDDAPAVVEGAGYFNNARLRFVAGDMIDAAMTLGGTPVTKRYIVTASPATGNVTIALQATT